MTGHELLPHKLLSELHSDVESLKKRLGTPDAKAQELILEIESMKESIHELTTVFQKALEEMKEDDISKTLAGLRERVDASLKQNETIARSMLAISDKMDDLLQQRRMTSEAPMLASGMPVKHTMGMPMQEQMGRVAPRTQAAMPMSDRSEAMNIPPPPKMMDKKRSLGNIFT